MSFTRRQLEAAGLVPESEATFTARVVALARANGWLVMHQRPACTARGWRTAVQGDAGFPDLVLVRPNARGAGRILFVELKTDTGRPSESQLRWAETLLRAGAEYHLWRPSEWRAIEETLA